MRLNVCKFCISCYSFAGKCGSCYAFSSLGMNEARLRIASNNSIQLTFAPQDIVDCSRYSQGMTSCASSWTVAGTGSTCYVTVGRQSSYSIGIVRFYLLAKFVLNCFACLRVLCNRDTFVICCCNKSQMTPAYTGCRGNWLFLTRVLLCS